MSERCYSVIIGTGSYIPTEVVKNDTFLDRDFYDDQGCRIDRANTEIIEKLRAITGIDERRYVTDDLVTSDIAFFAAEDALASSGTDKESLDYIIVAHNFGDVDHQNRKSDLVPSLASRVKRHLKINNPYTVAMDIPFGCPGWLQGTIQADFVLRASPGKRALVIGAETLSRVSDPHDRDSMIYADGAGAIILESVPSTNPKGILSHVSRSDAVEYGTMLHMGQSNNPAYDHDAIFLKMQGHKLYKYALKTVPKVVKQCLDDAGLSLTDIKKIFLHQANQKMDEQITKRVYEIYGQKNIGQQAIHDIMPLTISWLGNSSVATVPTLMDLTFKNKLNGHHVVTGDNVLIASVGAGMNVSALVYRI